MLISDQIARFDTCPKHGEYFWTNEPHCKLCELDLAHRPWDKPHPSYGKFPLSYLIEYYLIMRRSNYPVA